MEEKEKKKVFVKPEAEVLDFGNNDIITFSNGSEYPDEWIGERWTDQ